MIQNNDSLSNCYCGSSNVHVQSCGGSYPSVICKNCGLIFKNENKFPMTELLIIGWNTKPINIQQNRDWRQRI